MVKLGQPALSASASGTLADILCFANPNGRRLCKKKPKPRQPNTAKQLSSRAILSFLVHAWSALTDLQRATWTTLGTELNLPPYNAFLKYNLARWRQNRGPSKDYPATDTPVGWEPLLYLYGGVRCCRMMLRKGAAAEDWGYAIHRLPYNEIPADLSDVATIVPISGVTDQWYDDSPLIAQTYDYAISVLMFNGYVVRFSSYQVIAITDEP